MAPKFSVQLLQDSISERKIFNNFFGAGMPQILLARTCSLAECILHTNQMRPTLCNLLFLNGFELVTIAIANYDNAHDIYENPT